MYFILFVFQEASSLKVRTHRKSCIFFLFLLLFQLIKYSQRFRRGSGFFFISNPCQDSPRIHLRGNMLLFSIPMSLSVSFSQDRQGQSCLFLLRSMTPALHDLLKWQNEGTV